MKKNRSGLTRHEFIHIVLPFLVPLFVFVAAFAIGGIILAMAGDTP